MTVKELIEQLQQLPPELPVVCWQPGSQREPVAASRVFSNSRDEFVAMIETNTVETRC